MPATMKGSDDSDGGGDLEKERMSSIQEDDAEDMDESKSPHKPHQPPKMRRNTS